MVGGVVARCVQCTVLSTPFFDLCCAVGECAGMYSWHGTRILGMEHVSVRAAPRGVSVAVLRLIAAWGR